MNDFSSSFCVYNVSCIICPCLYVNIGTEFHRPWLVLSKEISINNYLF